MLELIASLALFIGPPMLSGPTISFADAQHGWVGGGGGIFATTNGGATWKLQSRFPALELAAVDARHAWVLSEQGETLRTTDGTHWRNLGVQHLLRISFVDARHGFALERDPFVMRTDDGGRSWRPIPGPQRLQTLCFSDARTGWVARGGSVWATHDTGAHWRRTILLRDQQGFPIPELGCRKSDVWVVFHEGAGLGTEGYHVFRSLDRGATWRAVLATPWQQKLPSISNYSGPFSIVGGGVAALEGSCSPCGYGSVTVVTTRDGGRSFTRKTFRSEYPGPISFADARHGFVVLTSPTGKHRAAVWRTTDGGRTWRRVLVSSALVPS